MTKFCVLEQLEPRWPISRSLFWKSELIVISLVWIGFWTAQLTEQFQIIAKLQGKIQIHFFKPSFSSLIGSPITAAKETLTEVQGRWCFCFLFWERKAGKLSYLVRSWRVPQVNCYNTNKLENTIWEWFRRCYGFSQSFTNFLKRNTERKKRKTLRGKQGGSRVYFSNRKEDVLC